SNAAAPAAGNATAEAQHDQVPSVWVLDAPSGFQTQGPAGPGEAGQWQELVSAGGGCTLSARGDVAEKPGEEMGSASRERRASVAAAGGDGAEPAQDRTLVSSGAGAGSRRKGTRTFGGADCAGADGMGRGGAGVTSRLTYAGARSRKSLALRCSWRADTIGED